MKDRPHIPPDYYAPNPDYYPSVRAYEKDGKKFVKVHGLEIEVRPDEECSACELRLCALVEHLPDYKADYSAIGACHFCNKPVYWDTRLPKGPTQKFICMYCAIKEGGQDSFAT